ncbi:unnamed protein product [Didymodactylos carnosus]|uniref:Uncharacterized protein n=1 Tax=Didymodactylos carnosus TaxID=1234261 RepID=A0A815THI4_9BILA|nr:unnamed protein product [Didymodactylos carnosus]CAF1506548.1 unnamed protein product [Didymodactylos carnosus]CAF4228059.1 unnamed protein product [Didymodactylos carnosus]CAF4367726.1 unnamed protein product [Didymodactylos carnosus]
MDTIKSAANKVKEEVCEKIGDDHLEKARDEKRPSHNRAGHMREAADYQYKAEAAGAKSNQQESRHDSKA